MTSEEIKNLNMHGIIEHLGRLADILNKECACTEDEELCLVCQLYEIQHRLKELEVIP